MDELRALIDPPADLTLQLTGQSKIEATAGGGSRFVLEFPLAHVPMG